ncbi:cell division ATP-binding protein FtsE [Rhodospirillum centenum]|uniref:Cell division ATP-binding protein FtsE n=1 Tax=Rhodospirillum centenum (strain ATCC 51521 / SW) TaxID=414684 RepID=B6IW79_RHOCS|nr:cell division ATP-binding protein FtsE [Rhodospirillum centenum]ACJ00553.1 cell division ATP-binding protein FtsE [Rhodospirillum centenum SW]
MVRFENVGLRYGTGPEVLRDISFELAAGSFHFLTGPTGAGKSSLLKLLTLSERPSRGLVSLFGQQLSTLPRGTLPELRRRIGVVFQDFRLLDHMTVFDNVALPLRIAGTGDRRIQEAVTDLLAWVGLGDRMHLLPPVLSGGQKQLVAIARAVVTSPQLIVADEPTGNIDREMSHKIMRLFIEMNKLGTTVVVATHDMYLVDRLQKPVLELYEGKLAEASWWLSPDRAGRPAPEAAPSGPAVAPSDPQDTLRDPLF